MVIKYFKDFQGIKTYTQKNTQHLNNTEQKLTILMHQQLSERTLHEQNELENF